MFLQRKQHVFLSELFLLPHIQKHVTILLELQYFNILFYGRKNGPIYGKCTEATIIMHQLEEFFKEIIDNGAYKLIISKARNKSEEYKKIVIEKKENYYQIAKYTDKQVFHKNVKTNELVAECVELTDGHFSQVNAWTGEWEYYILISKKGNAALKRNKLAITVGTGKNNPVDIPDPNDINHRITSTQPNSHNRKKNYILKEGTPILPLVDMGIFTKEGKVVRSMYDKFKQINRFIEIIDDSVKTSHLEEIHVIDFGCGKSYLTFILYYYLTEIKKMKARIIGLDLKADVITHCNEVAHKYGYDGLSFEMGDINGYEAPFDVDMVITLHACDTATDYALYNAIGWNAKMIFSVPCCQHELNSQIQTDSFSILTDYGIIKERFSALATDAIRGKLLEYCGYKTQLLEFIDFAHTPKNILIRAIKRPITAKNARAASLAKANALCEEFHFEPTLYRLLCQK